MDEDVAQEIQRLVDVYEKECIERFPKDPDGKYPYRDTSAAAYVGYIRGLAMAQSIAAGVINVDDGIDRLTRPPACKVRNDG